MKKSNPLFIYDDALLRYKFHQDHPFNQQRLKMTVELLQTWGMLPDSQILAPVAATEEQLLLNHTSEYVKAVQQAGHGNPDTKEFEVFGLGTEDTPIFAGMHEASSLNVGGSILIGDKVMTGEIEHGINFAGGLHHAFPGRASGFCIYNDVSVLIHHLVREYQAKVLYIDTDAHHGDGVETSFYDSPDVMTVSIHETGRYLFPGTGFVTDRGKGSGYGYAVNIPLDAFTEDESWQDAFVQVMERVLNFFKPDVIVSQHGCDAHWFDPLTHLSITMDTYRKIPQWIHEWAHAHTDGRWIALGGGGYDIWRVVPRAWSMVWMAMNDLPVEDREMPKDWLEKWQARASVQMPASLFDREGWFKPIPRRKEIEQKNRQTVAQILRFFP
ncbi:MAG: acetoin utilization protein AcuC [Bacillaceae bacterium]|nr:acetoin utilization protein AcuC [Bacillaceae bacterium]